MKQWPLIPLAENIRQISNGHDERHAKSNTVVVESYGAAQPSA